MSKIICEICGTVYPDNATQCPICGFPAKGEETPQLGQVEAAVPVMPDETQVIEPVKGGRFSNSNVKKRNKAEQPASEEAPVQNGEETPDEDVPSNDGRGLKIAVIVLLIGVLLVGGYILFRFFIGADAYDQAAGTEPAGQVIEDNEEDPDTNQADTGIACTNLVLSDSNVTLSGQGRGWLLSVTAVPADTTDTITYASSDDSVATISSDGRITAVAPGTCMIIISCGDITKECKVYCDFEVEDTDENDADPSDETDGNSETTDETSESTDETQKPSQNTTATTTEKEGFNLSHTDVTFSFKGDHFTFTAGKGISNAQVTWSIDKPEVAAISSNGKVVAVGPGTAEITATYEGETQKCIIRCTFEDDGNGETGATTEGTVSTDTSWKISHEDVTISIGESFQLTITNDSGETATVTWTAGNSELVTANGNTITGKASGNTTVTCNFNGQTYSCIVRVK